MFHSAIHDSRGYCRACGRKGAVSKVRAVVLATSVIKRSDSSSPQFRVIARPYSFRVQELLRIKGFNKRLAYQDIQRIGKTKNKLIPLEMDCAIAAMNRHIIAYMRVMRLSEFTPKSNEETTI